MICAVSSVINRFLKDRKDVNSHRFNPSLNVKTDDMMQGFVVTSFSIPSGEAKKGFMMDEEEENNAATVNGRVIGGYTNWEEQ